MFLVVADNDHIKSDAYKKFLFIYQRKEKNKEFPSLNLIST